MVRQIRKHYLVRPRRALVLVGLSLGVLTAACAQSGAPAGGASENIVQAQSFTNPYAVQNDYEMIGGPQAEALPGDVVMSNGVVRVAIRQPGRYPGVGSFGGSIIDADFVRAGGPALGRDQFGVMLPLINMEWSVNTRELLAFRDFDIERFTRGELAPIEIRDPDVKNPVIVAIGTIQPYAFLDIDFLEPVAKALTGQSLYYDPRYDDVFAPFQSTDLRGIRPTVITEYRLPEGARHVEMRTTIFNDGDNDVALPVGDFINGSGALERLIPGQGFAPALLSQITNDAPALIYSGAPGVNISYGYFYQMSDFMDPKDANKRLQTASLSYSGVTGFLFGETLLKVLPLGGGKTTEVHTMIPAHGYRTFTRFFVIGDGSAGSVLDDGLQALHVPTKTVSGRVTDSDGAPAAGAVVALLNDAGQTVVTYRTDDQGRFSGLVATGTSAIAKAFGGGIYTVRVEKPGYVESGSGRAGTCTPEGIDLNAGTFADVQCRLGAGGVVALAGPMRDATTNAPMPVRVTIIGSDPSPDRSRPGIFTDNEIDDRPYGVVKLFYLNVHGGVDASDEKSLRLEPGDYLFTYSRGPEYELRTQAVHVASYGVTSITPGVLRRVMSTIGYVSADFHVHASPSPDSATSVYQRAIAAAGEGLDVLHSSDHDFLFDYGPIVTELEARGVITPGTLATIVGDEITPNHLGHMHAFPLNADARKPAGGAVDWSLVTDPTIGPGPAAGPTIQQILDRVRDSYSGELVLQINHISDQIMSLLVVSGLVTTTAYEQNDGVAPLSSFSDPVGARLPYNGPTSLPMAWGTSPHTGNSFTAMELTIGPELATNKLLETALPQWFNFLNLGYIVTATGDSDSHVAQHPLGLPRNFVRSDVDPADGLGKSTHEISTDEYAKAINDHHVIVSAGPFITMTATNEQGTLAEIGETLKARQATIHVRVEAPSWAWFDTIELYANTEPVPVDDDNFGIMRGKAEHAKNFYEPYHVPHFSYEPQHVWSLRDGTLKNWKEENGKIVATVELPMTFNTDTWVVAFVRGTAETKGFRSLYPLTFSGKFAPNESQEKVFVGAPTLDQFANDPHMQTPAWAFTNPIFIDVDGDTNNDGKPFEAIYVKQGVSPMR